MPAAIRTATPKDIDALTAIESRVFPGNRLSRRSFAHLISAPSASVLVAEVAGSIAGYAVVLFRRGLDTARLYSVASIVKGQGSALLDAAEAAAAARAAHALRLEVRRDNARAIALYRRAGYAPIGEVRAYYDDGMAALRFQKVLGVPRRNVRQRPALPASESSAR
jgi:ribosomal protein S18 acetylase RimI-like enzyme